MMNLGRCEKDCFPVTGSELRYFISDGPELKRILFVILILYIWVYLLDSPQISAALF
jgi:hypothetical protein